MKNETKLMMKAAEKAGINTRNGDTYFLEEKPVAGEKLLKMTRYIIKEVKEELESETLNETKGAVERNEQQEISQQPRLLTDETINFIERQVDRIINKLDDLKESKRETTSEDSKVEAEFKEGVKSGLSKTEESLERHFNKELEKNNPGRGQLNAPKLVRALLESDSGELTTRELALKTRVSKSSVEDAMRYVAKNVNGIDKDYKKVNGVKNATLKINKRKLIKN